MTKEVPITIAHTPDAATLAFIQMVMCDLVRRDIRRFGAEEARRRWLKVSEYYVTEDWWPSVARKVNDVFDEIPEELFHFIHPAVDDNQAKKMHDEVARLVRRFGIQDICLYLLELQSEAKVLLPPAENMYNELGRMGMPTGDGFSLKTFMRYYKRK